MGQPHLPGLTGEPVLQGRCNKRRTKFGKNPDENRKEKPPSKGAFLFGQGKNFWVPVLDAKAGDVLDLSCIREDIPQGA